MISTHQYTHVYIVLHVTCGRTSNIKRTVWAIMLQVDHAHYMQRTLLQLPFPIIHSLCTLRTYEESTTPLTILLKSQTVIIVPKLHVLCLARGSTTPPYSLKFKYFADWPNSAQKQTFADKIFVVERAYQHITITCHWATFSQDKILAGGQ